MKKGLMILAFVLVFSPVIFAGDDIDEKNVPEVVKNKFRALYPEAKQVEWEYETKKAYYEIEFKLDGVKGEMKISTTGEVLENENMVPISELPKKALEHIKKEYNDPTIIFVKKVIKKNYGKYIVKIRYNNEYGKSGKGGRGGYGNKRHYTLVFDEEGNSIKG